ncbi:MAG: type IV pilin protein [Burkholderiales bacterium]|nr:type IV pilin protein [Burkholderiales bacterium]
MDYLRRGAIPEGLAELSNQKVKMEQFFLNNRTYVGQQCTTINSSAAGKFTFACVATPSSPPDPGSFTLTATGKSGSLVDGFVYTITNKNIKATVSTGVWGKADTNCWILKKDGAC